MNNNILKNRIGIIGCGSMGLPMLKNIIKKKINASGYDIKNKKHYLDIKNNFIPSKKLFFDKNDIIFSVVRDIKETEEICLGNNGIFYSNNKKILLLCSTLSPQYLKELKIKSPSNITIIDAPISGAPIKAEKASLTFMIGSKKKEFNFLSPLLNLMGKNILYIGEYGSGMSVKVLNNFVAATSVLSVRHVLAESKKLGIDSNKLLEVLNLSSGQTWYGSNIENIDWSKQSYNSKNTIGILEKDVLSYLDTLHKNSKTIGNSIKIFHSSLLENLRKIPKFPKPNK
jgi:3-hydroxyisobutyrate dehydrogenase-like beta-hydroxyacid dehydrogenase